MDRIQTLCNKLQEQLDAGASADELLLTVEMLRSELFHWKEQQANDKPPVVAVDLPPAPIELPALTPAYPEKVIEILQVEEKEVEAELEEIKKNLNERNKFGSQYRATIQFDAVEDTPTLFHQEPGPEKTPEVHEFIAQNNPASLHDKFRDEVTEFSVSPPEAPIKDLRKGVGVNDRFLFINELFRGDDVMYERSIKTINAFRIFEEAEFWIKRELKLKLGWDDSNPVVQQFDQLIKRRFS